MSDFLANMNEMNNEHDAWLQFVEEWKAIIDGAMNDAKYNPLIRAIEVWGEELVQLRLKQTPEDVQRALVEKREAYRDVQR